MKIKSILAAALVALVVSTGSTTAFAQSKSKSLVVYFSWSGTTEKMAKMIASSTGADLFRLEPAEAYPTSYKDCADIVKKELDGGKIRTVKSAPDLAKYDTIFVGVPVWWHTAPTLVTHFLEAHSADLKGKTVIPFCTYQATYRDATLEAIAAATPTAKHKDGYGTTSPKQGDVDSWLKRIGFGK